MKNKKILVLGGTGKTGRRVAEKLLNLGVDIRIGSRNANPSFEWNDPEVWPKVLEGISAVYIAYQPDLAVPGAAEAITKFSALAVEKGIKKLVLLSGRGEEEAQKCEEIVMRSGADWTVVRADWFFQNFSESFFLDPILAGHVALPRADAKIPFVDADDIAEVAVKALLDDGHNGKVHELTGPRMITFEEAVREISEATGRDIKFTPISLEKYNEMLEEHGVPADYRWLINYLFTNVLDGRNSSTTDGVEKALGRKPRDFSEYVHDTAQSGIWMPNNAG